jgi:hypothetical protein
MEEEANMDRSNESAHDLGGQSRFVCKPIERKEREPIDDFGRRVDAMRLIVGAAKLVTVDELRRGVEQLDPQDYENFDYYERWLHSITAILLEKGVLKSEDLQ